MIGQSQAPRRATHRILTTLFSLLAVPGLALAGTAGPIRLPGTPTVSPDGSTVAFAWAGDLWSVPTSGGVARRLTSHEARDSQPVFSPDGSQLAFVSDREGSPQVFIMPAAGGAPRQVTFHTAGSTVQAWFPDGKHLLVQGARDHFWRKAERLFKVSIDERTAEVPLFDDYGTEPSLSPDGRSLLFVREGVAWWRKGYQGSQDAQIWRFDLDTGKFTKLIEVPGGARFPLWRPDGQAFYYVARHDRTKTLNLRERELASGADKSLTDYDDDSVVFPALSRDGKTLVFRHLFDLYRIDPTQPAAPSAIPITHDADLELDPAPRVAVERAREVAFSRDGLEIAFVAGGDVWVMDTELREPRQITRTPEEERDPVFSPDGAALLFVSDAGGQADLWVARRADATRYWWQNDTFPLTRLTTDSDVESSPRFSPDGKLISYIRGLGDLWLASTDGSEPRRLLTSWDAPDYEWSPDGRWIAYAVDDDDFNRDVWITPIDGSRVPYNVSRHPDNEGPPTWSPDGKALAFSGRRFDTEVDVYFVYLDKSAHDASSRDRTIEKALEKMKKRSPQGDKRKDDDKPKSDKPESEKPAAEAGKNNADSRPAADKLPEVVIDFDDLHERLRRISIPDSSESDLVWSPDSKKLAFVATVDGKRGLYAIEPPDNLKPALLSSTLLDSPTWLKEGNQIVGLDNGTPASISPGGATTSYRLRALQRVDLPARFRAAFDLAWRTMRDRWYDERLGNRNWDAIRRKYADLAAQSTDPDMLADVIRLMLGELNGSHLGFTPSPGGGPPPSPNDPPAEPTIGRSWPLVTAHLGLRFDPAYKGPGLKVRDVLPGGPANTKKVQIAPGEIVLSIDGTTVDPALDLTTILNGRPDRDVQLHVRNDKGEERDVVIRPISYNAARLLLYDHWVRHNRALVDEASKGTLGYLHIAGMNLPSFHQFEEDLYAAGAGKDGLIIDVRENGGGSTADLLLTSLTQPVHAITVPRGGGPGYPHDRKVYATWSKPIIVLCNQNSFSNAEIFSHAIKTLKRGRLVGVPTAGGVVSTGGTSIMDIGFLRLPFRGWYLVGNGEDMELNGAVPDVILWPAPGDLPAGKDEQLSRAVELLREDVDRARQTPAPKLRKATERQ